MFGLNRIWSNFPLSALTGIRIRTANEIIKPSIFLELIFCFYLNLLILLFVWTLAGFQFIFPIYMMLLIGASDLEGDLLWGSYNLFPLATWGYGEFRIENDNKQNSGASWSLFTTKHTGRHWSLDCVLIEKVLTT